MSKKLRILALVLATLLTLSIFAGCDKSPVNDNSSVMTQSEVGGNEDENTQGGNQDAGDETPDDTNSETESKTSTITSNKKLDINKTGWPITNKKVTFEVMGRTSANAADPNKMSMFSYMEKNTNVGIKYIPVNENDIRERKTLALQSGDIPAAFAFTYNTFSDFELDKYSREGAFVDVSKYLKDYAPTIYSELEKHPVQKALNVTSDGKIYTLPTKTSRSDYTNYDHYLNINRTWLENLGLRIPTADDPYTIDEFLEVMRAFRDQDPNGNNQSDEIPFGLWNWGAGWVLAFWGCHVGAGNLAVDLNHKVYFPLTSTNAKAACQWWYDFLNEDGLMDGGIVGQNKSGSWTEFTSHISKGNVGCFQWSYLGKDRFPSELLKDFVAIPYPVASFKNSNLKLSASCQPYNSVPQRGKIIFTKACTNVPALLRYFDYLFTDDGIMVGNYGDPAKGLYKKLSNGNYKLTDKGMVANAGLKQAPGWTMALPEPTAMINIKIEETTDKDSKVYTEYATAAKKMYKKANEKYPQIRLSGLMLTSSEITKLRKFNEEFASSGTAGRMSYYVQSKNNALQNWVTDVQEFEKKGINDYVKLYQGIVNRNKQFLVPLA